MSGWPIGWTSDSVDRLPVAAGQRLVDDLVEHRLPAEPGLQQLRGRLTGPEAGQPHLFGQLLIGPLEIGLELGERHLHIDAHPGGAQLLDAALHGVCSLVVVAGGRWPCGQLARRVLVGVTGFEPAAFRSQSGCATKLRYTPH